jgi:thiol-disulfide isomerase/thioredoxin
MGTMSIVTGYDYENGAKSDHTPVPTAGSSPRTVLIEMYTATWCGPCANAAPALSRIGDEFHDKIAVLDWHSNTSLIGHDMVTPRKDDYGWRLLPSCVFDGGGDYPDGTLWAVGSNDPDWSYNRYRNILDPRMAENTNLRIDLTGGVIDSGVNVTARIEATDPVTQTDLYVYFALYEDDLYANSFSTLGAYWRHVVRNYTREPLSISDGEVVTIEKEFAVEPGWDVQRLGIVVFVQSDVISGTWPYSTATHNNREVLQAATMDFIPEKILLVNDEDYTYWDINEGKYQKLLSYYGYSFDTWNLQSPSDTGPDDFRGTPTYDDIKNYSVVVWFTGNSTSTLDAGEQATLSSYLDSQGSLFILGENIGADIGATVFYADYLHASFASDSSMDGEVLGVLGDPISDQWSGISLTVNDTSPDVIDPADVSTTTTFTYLPSGTNAALRSDHDFNSRMVYFGFNLFELDTWKGPPDSVSKEVMDKVLRWLDIPPLPPTLTTTGVSADFKNITITWDRSPDDGTGYDDVTRYDVFVSSSYWGPFDYRGSLLADDSLQYTYTNIDAGLDPSNMFYRVEAADGIWHSSPTAKIGKFFQSFSTGATLASFPVTPVDNSLPSALKTLDYDMVWTYDALDPSDPWKSFSDLKPYKGDLTDLNNTRGFWVVSNSDRNLVVTGFVTACTDIHLYAGWNLVSYPAFVERTVSVALSGIAYDRIEGFDPTNPPSNLKELTASDMMTPGGGYWIKVPVDDTWTVCN